ncbi:hypothetical protein [Caulobacter sp. CCG-8]|uniref:hypothetical protein n=1 Tax=Caulobacter sp. CCG-8 TaxID=3127958 RepID=UPI00307CDA7E
MKIVIIILILIILGFVVAIGVAVYRATTPPAPPSAHGPPTDSNGNIDEDALADWEPPSMAAVMGSISRPFAPKLFKKAEVVEFPAGQDRGSRTVSVPAADKDMRMARLRLIQGRGAVATYTVLAPGQGETSPQAVCLCAENTRLDEDEVDDCGDAWRKVRRSGDQFLCRAKDDDVSAVIYRSGGVIEIKPLGDQPLEVTVR